MSLRLNHLFSSILKKYPKKISRLIYTNELGNDAGEIC